MKELRITKYTLRKIGRGLIITCGLFCFIEYGFSQKLPDHYRGVVADFIENVRTNNISELSKNVQYPLKREFPLSAIESTSEFKRRYSEIFDDNLKDIIINSDLDSDWGEFGWRGILLNNGTIWLDKEGNLTLVAYQSEAEKLQRDSLIQADRQILHESLKEYESPVLTMRTTKLFVRIDFIKNSVSPELSYYRFASWTPNRENINDIPLNEEPDQIIINGKLKFDEISGNHHYTFVLDDDVILKCFITPVKGDFEPPARLEITRHGVLKDESSAYWVKN